MVNLQSLNLVPSLRIESLTANRVLMAVTMRSVSWYASNQAAKLAQGGRIRGEFARQVDADKAPNGLAVVDRVFHTFIGQPKVLLGNIHP